MPILKPTANFNVWDVVSVPFPRTNRDVQQRRPALVVACYAAPAAPVLLWVLMITSATHRAWPGDVLLSDKGIAGLPAPSLVRCAKIATIEASHTTGLGCLAIADRALVRNHIGDMLASVCVQS
jgi:mRNA interferase MazF